MKKLWYLFVKMYMRLGFAFYFKKVTVSGTQNIPKDKAILFVANHQNALIDPLLIGSRTPRELNFLTRADVFNKPLITALLSTVNMMPIYRIKDGMTSLSKNEVIFEKCRKILSNNGTLLIFPEGNHNIKRRLRVLSKGFTRIVYGTLEKYPEQEIVIIPIGINYSDAREFASSVHLIYGEPIPVNLKGEKEHLNGASATLKHEVSEAMKKLITHIEDLDNYDSIEKSFEKEEFLDPTEVNKKILEGQYEQNMDSDETYDYHMLSPLIKANSFIPLIVWRKMYPKIDEVEFISTFRFTLGITLFPLVYIIQAWILASFTTTNTGLLYLILSCLSVYLFTKSR